ncbi:MAG TPA: GAF domain-containing protein [Polyangiaceae bacterium]|nr:GAF domain-containing protein [Polyangiaceae bacterium]
MSEGILLDPVPRGTLLPEPARLARLEQAAPQIVAALEGETDAVAVQATLACLLWQTLPQCNWCGFYRRVGERLLAVGPYQGTMGCLRIPFDRGVCGASARGERTVRVPDVRAFPGHIMCDDATRSELVVPVFGGGRLRAVLDLDSPHLDAFGEAEARALEALVERAFAAALVW